MVLYDQPASERALTLARCSIVSSLDLAIFDIGSFKVFRGLCTDGFIYMLLQGLVKYC